MLRFVLFILFIAHQSVSAQHFKGIVLDENNKSIPNVVLVLNDEIISVTNSKGTFSLEANYTFPIQIKLKHPDFYIKTVTLNKNNSKYILSKLNKTENLNPVIVSSSYQKESRVILPTSKITSKKFDAYSPDNLVAAINETPGVYIQSGALNTNRIVIRGVGSRTLYGTNKIRAYFNGIPITNGTGETSIDAFNPEDLDNLEIVKGPKATQYGTNLGGTLLLNSKQAAKGETFFKTNLTLGSYGLIKNNISLATNTNKLDLNINYDYLKTDGFRDNNKYNRNTVVVTSNYTFNENNTLGVILNYTNFFAQIPSSISKSAFQEDPSQAAYTWGEAQGYEKNKQVLAGVNYTHRFTDRFSNTTTVFYTYLDHYEPRPFNILDEFTNGYGARTLFANDFKFLKHTANLSFGTELYNDLYNWKTLENLYEENNGNGSLKGQLLSNNEEKRKNLNAFATVTLPFTSKLKAQIGMNFNLTHYQFIDFYNPGTQNKSADRDFNPIWAPNLNILYQLKHNIKAFANISRGFNYPSIEETLTPEGVVNPDLGPEIGWNYEVGSEIFLFNSTLQIQLSAYLLDIDNLLVADRISEDQYIGRNAGKTQHKGIELAINYTHIFNTDYLLSPYLNTEFTDHRFVDFIDQNNDFSGNKLTGVPDIKINGGLVFKYKSININTNFLHIGSMPLNDANTLDSNPYTVLNLKIAYSNSLSKHLSLEINGGINNFTNESYASSVLINAVGFGGSEPRYYYPGMPRNWFGGFKLGYTI